MAVVTESDLRKVERDTLLRVSDGSGVLIKGYGAVWLLGSGVNLDRNLAVDYFSYQDALDKFGPLTILWEPPQLVRHTD